MGIDRSRILNSTSKLQRGPVILVLVTLVIALIFIVLKFYDDNLRFSDRLAILPTVNARYEELRSKIFNATNDVLLKDDPGQMHLLRDKYAGCIRGASARTYGTNRPYDTVLTDYAKVFADGSWEQRPDQQYYESNVADVSLTLIDPSSPDYSVNKENCKTVYRILLYYADPSTTSCTG